MTEFELVLGDLAFPEGPRWREGELWFSDMQGGEVVRLSPDGTRRTVVTLDEGECPSGLGFLPDGRLLVVAMHARQVLAVDADGSTTVHADLSEIATWHANDMLVDSVGRAYVGNFGDSSAPPDPITPATLALVQPDGTVTAAADQLDLPNGMVLLDDGRTLVVAETRALPPRITAFTVGPDGELSERRTVVELSTELPDGMTVDDVGRIWFASPFTGELIRITSGGEVTARLACPRPPYACAWADGHLYVCVADDWVPEVCRANRTGAILRVDVCDL